MNRCANWASPLGSQPDRVISTDTYIHGSVALPFGLLPQVAEYQAFLPGARHPAVAHPHQSSDEEGMIVLVAAQETTPPNSFVRTGNLEYLVPCSSSS